MGVPSADVFIHSPRVSASRRTEVGFEVVAGGWVSNGTAVVVDGQVSIEQVTITVNHHAGAHLPPGGLTTTAIREVVPIAEIRRQVAVVVGGDEDYGALTEAARILEGRRDRKAVDHPQARPDSERGGEVAPRSVGRPALADEVLARVAFHRVKAEVDGAENVTEVVRVAMSEAQGRQVPTSTVKEWMRRAVAEGWLVGTGPGRRGASIGPKLSEWVATIEREGNRDE